MVKKLLASTALLLGCMSSSYAVSLYFGAAAEFDNMMGGSASYNGFAPRALLGFGGNIFSPVYLAGEIFADEDVIDQNNTLDQNQNSVRTRFSYGGSLLPGISFDPDTVAFVRLGAVETRFNDLNLWRTGYQIGLGGQLTFFNCWTVRGEYTYSRYRNLSQLDGNLHSNSYLLSLIYDINF